jgi:hypothetical protein
LSKEIFENTDFYDYYTTNESFTLKAGHAKLLKGIKAEINVKGTGFYNSKLKEMINKESQPRRTFF